MQIYDVKWPLKYFPNIGQEIKSKIELVNIKTPRIKFIAFFKAKVAINAIKEQSIRSNLAAKFEIYPAQISNWKRDFLKNADLTFIALTARVPHYFIAFGWLYPGCG